MKSNRFLLPLLGIFILSQNIQAQMVARDGFKEGYKAIQFGIGDNFRLTTFDGSSLSLLRYTSENTAQYLRFSINYTFRTSSSESTSNNNPDEPDYISTDAQENDAYDFDNSFTLTLGKQNYIQTESDILPFISRAFFVGTTINYDKRDQLSTSINGDNSYIRTNKSDSWKLSPYAGLNVGVGIDFFIAKNISLNAQTGIDLLYQYYRYNQDLSQDSEDNGGYTLLAKRNAKDSNHTVSLQSTGVLFGLSAYF